MRGGRSPSQSKRRIDDDGVRHRRRAVLVVRGQIVVLAARRRRTGSTFAAAQSTVPSIALRVGVEQQLRGVEAQAARGVVGAVHAVAVALARLDVRQEAVPGEEGRVADLDALLVALARRRGRARRARRARRRARSSSPSRSASRPAETGRPAAPRRASPASGSSCSIDVLLTRLLTRTARPIGRAADVPKASHTRRRETPRGVGWLATSMECFGVAGAGNVYASRTHRRDGHDAAHDQEPPRRRGLRAEVRHGHGDAGAIRRGRPRHGEERAQPAAPPSRRDPALRPSPSRPGGAVRDPRRQRAGQARRRRLRCRSDGRDPRGARGRCARSRPARRASSSSPTARRRWSSPCRTSRREEGFFGDAAS